MLDPNNELTLFIHDTLRFISAFITPISESAPHIYLSALYRQRCSWLVRWKGRNLDIVVIPWITSYLEMSTGQVYEQESRDLDVQRKRAFKFKASQASNLERQQYYHLSLQIPYTAAWLSSEVVVSQNSTHWFGSHHLSRVSIAAGWFLAKPELGSVSWHPPYNQKSPARRESGDIGIHHLKQHVRLRCTIHRISQFDQNPSWICPIEDPLSYINPIEAMLLRQWSW